ncbi:MAG: ABC transporter ATP-binding protein [Arenicellales bacterium]
MASNTFHLFSNYLKNFLEYAELRAVWAAGLLFTAGLLQGIGLLMLIPLLGLTGFISTDAASNKIVTTLQGFFDSLGLNYSLTTVLFIFFLILTAEALFTRYRSVLLNNLQLDYTDHLRNRLYRSIGHASWQFHSHHHSADSVHLLDEVVSDIGQGTYSALQLFVVITQAIVYLLVSLQISPVITVLMMITGLLLYGMVIPINRRVFRHGQRAVEASRTLYRTMAEFFAGLKLAKSYNRTESHIEEFISDTRKLRGEQKALMSSSVSAQMWLRILTVALLCLFVYFSLTAFSMGADRLILLIILANRLYQALSSGQNYWQYMLRMLPAYEAYIQAADKFNQHAEAQHSNDKTVPPLQHEITLKKVSFYYTDKQHAALEDINITIPAKQTTAITGPSGAGKSTLADILMGILTPDNGKLFVDEMELAPEILPAWREHVAYVPQEVHLFDDSIRSNLNWACKEEKQEEDLWAALEAAAAADFIRQLPDGLDSLVGERGLRLSGGERQRIALARAILRKPDVLILDEATSALDRENEHRIQEAISQLHGNLTIILIAHRESTVQQADYVIELDRGKVK